ncbi:MAG TPA: hypothetical protein VFE91_02580 [Nitrososphaerales archaeon]|nr:hypothetical protein [Nitrososphaerales archaeon]
MSSIKTFFRHCPGCGRRFEIHLVGKQTVGEEEEEALNPGTPGAEALVQGAGASQPGNFVHLSMGSQPAVVDRKEFRYAYKCSHCGHTWTEYEFKD